MSIQIIQGKFKNFSLKTAKEINYRPTSVMLRRKVFDYYQDLSGYIFVDLCAGSGSMGIEALSRGAESIFINEINKKNFISIKENIKNLEERYPEKYEIIIENLSFDKFIIKNYQNFINLKFNSELILFFDPPYEETNLYIKFHALLSELKDLEAQIWIEFCNQKCKNINIEAMFKDFIKLKEYSAGSKQLIIFEKRKINE